MIVAVPESPAPPVRHPVVTFGPYVIDWGLRCSVAVRENRIKIDDDREVTVHVTSIRCEAHDERTGEWQETRYWRPAALPVLARALLEAHAWILGAETRDPVAPR